MARGVRSALALLIAAAGGACLSRPTVVPKLYSIDAPPSPASSGATGARVIALRKVRVAPPFDGRELVYRTGEHRLERDPYADLAAAPGDLLTEAIRGYLHRAPFVRDVVEPGSDRAADLLVESYASELSGDFSRPGAPVAVLTVEFNVMAAESGSSAEPLVRKQYARRIPMAQRTAAAVVTAWNVGLGEIMREFQGDLTVALARASARSAERRAR